MFAIQGYGDPTGLDATELAARFVELEHQRRLIDAALSAVVGEVVRTGAHRADGHASALAWCRSLGRWSTAEARHAIRLARLAAEHDGFAEHYHQGRVGIRQADAIARVRANPRCGDELLTDLDRFLDRADRAPWTEFHHRLEEWKHLHDVDGAFRDRDHIHQHRDASIDVWDGAVTGALRGGAADGAFLREVLDRFVDAEFAADRDRAGPDAPRASLPRTDAQRRFDALIEVFRRAVATPVSARDPIPSVTITCDVHTLDALVNRHPTLPTTRDVWTPGCATSDGTPIAPGDVLPAIWWGRIRTAIIDDHRDVVGLGNHRRLFTGKARDAVMLHAERCVWPGCEAFVRRCQADHLTEHARGGCTRPDNGAPLCGRHNRFKSGHGYRVARHPDGGWITVRPDGTELRQPPGPRGSAPPGRSDLAA